MKTFTLFSAKFVSYFICFFVLLFSLNNTINAQVSFTVDTSQGCKPLTVTFTNTSTVGNFFYWDYDDYGSGYAGFDTSHTFTSSGEYNVRLSAMDTTGSGGDPSKFIMKGSYQKMITVFGIRYMGTSSDSACVNEEVQYYFGGAGDSLIWDFGDGGSSTKQRPVHTYTAAGSYTVKFILYHPCGSDTMTRTVVANDAARPNVMIRINPNSKFLCPGDPFSFELNTSEISTTQYIWAFGDADSAYSTRTSHSYATAGTYVVTLSATNKCGNSNATTDTIMVSDSAYFGNIGLYIPNVCVGDFISPRIYDGASSYSSYIWDFGDGTIDSTKAPLHAYADTGNYKVTATLTNGCGKDTTLAYTVLVDTTAVPELGGGGDDGENFGSTADENEGGGGCPGDSVIFYYGGVGDSIYWNFGDGAGAYATEKLFIEEGFWVTIVRHAYADTGTYTAKITVTNGCGKKATDSLQVSIIDTSTVNGDLIWDTPLNGPNYFACETVKFLSFGGVNYFWNFGDGDTVTTATGSINHAYSLPGTYNIALTITNGCGKTKTYNQSITIDSIKTTLAVTNISCNGANDGSIMLTATGGVPSLTYAWSNSASTKDISSLSAGSYTVTVSDANGCSVTNSATITEEAPLVAPVTSSTSTCGNSDGSATVSPSGGVAPYTYSWSSSPVQSTAIATGIPAGGYTVTVTDSKGCSKTAVANVNDTSAPSVSISSSTNASCNKVCDGSATVSVTGGITPYTYAWSTTPAQTSTAATGLCAGTYNITVTDSVGCIGVTSVTVTEPPAISINISVTNISCNAANDGSATANVTGGISPYTYNWNTGGNGTSITGLSAGCSFTVTVTDANGCTATSSTCITQPAALTPSISSTNITCNGGTDGSATVITGGGTLPYTYNWNPSGGNNISATSLSVGSYTVTVTDKNGCTVTVTTTITEPAAFKPTITQSSDTLISSTATSYQWYIDNAPVSGGTSQKQVILTIGYYKVNAVDGNGCSGTSDSVYVAVTGMVDAGVENGNLTIYPNPYNNNTNLSFELKEKGMVTLEVYNLLGEKIATVVDKIHNSGYFNYTFSAKSAGYTDGVYIVKLRYNNTIQMKRLIELR